MTNPPLSSGDRYDHLRANAAAQKRSTVVRLKQAIDSLEEAGRLVTTFTIREVSGLDYMAYYRNPEALALFRTHSTHLRAKRAKERAIRRSEKAKKSSDAVHEVAVEPRDPMLNYKKPRLVTELRALRDEYQRLRQNYQALLQEHMQCGLTIARLEAKEAEYLAFMERFRSSLKHEEQDTKS